jgi:Carboxypeptidase regulatory-like domain
MKMLLAAAACLFFDTLASGECVTVSPIMTTTFQMSPDIVVTASLDGRPARGARIEVRTAFNNPRFSLVGDERGVATLPVLSPGSYHIVAVTPPQALGEVYLAEITFDVSQNLTNRPSLLNMDLVSANQFWPRDLPVDELFAPIGKPLAVGAVQRFQGSVIDPQGSTIVGATIRVFKQKSSGQALITQTNADERGRFSASLEPGAYTASVQMPGFRTRMITFEIAPSADAKDVEISLNIGSC